jgi:hypothetical protein
MPHPNRPLTWLILPSDQPAAVLSFPQINTPKNALVLPSHAAALNNQMAPFPQAHIVNNGTLHSGPTHIMSLWHGISSLINAAAGLDIEQWRRAPTLHCYSNATHMPKHTDAQSIYSKQQRVAMCEDWTDLLGVSRYETRKIVRDQWMERCSSTTSPFSTIVKPMKASSRERQENQGKHGEYWAWSW